MKQTIYSAHDLLQSFRNMGRGDAFTYEALGLLFDYLEGMDSQYGEYELDVIALCCEFSEDTPEEIIQAYGIESDSWDGICTASAYGLEQEAKAKQEAAMTYLEANTMIVGTTQDGSIVYASNF